MRPPMRQSITLLIPSGQKDDYGRPITVEQIVKARVQFTSRTIESSNGNKFQSNLEVDLFPDVPIKYGTRMKYEDPLTKVVTEGAVISIDESRNLAGTKVYFRTVFIG